MRSAGIAMNSEHQDHGAQVAGILARLSQASGELWKVSNTIGTNAQITIIGTDGERKLRVTRDAEPAAQSDIEFIGHARSDLVLLLRALEDGIEIPDVELDAIERRFMAASPSPWTPFIESDGGLAGGDVIRVTESDDEPDMYLWIEGAPAPSGDFRFVAAARRDLPDLLAIARAKSPQARP